MVQRERQVTEIPAALSINMSVDSFRNNDSGDDEPFWRCPQSTYWGTILGRLSRDFYRPGSVGIHQRLRRRTFRPAYDFDPYYRDEPQHTDERVELDRSRRLVYTISARRVAFLHERTEFARQLVDELDDRLTQGRIRRMTACSGGIKIFWQGRLFNDGKEYYGWTLAGGYEDQAYAEISLSAVRLDDEIRLRDTVAHEFCHVAATLLHRTREEHGLVWYLWARICEEAMAGRGIKVAHFEVYPENYEYIWTCTGICGLEIGYHTFESHDFINYPCRNCGGMMVQTNPVPRAAVRRDYWID